MFAEPQLEGARTECVRHCVGVRRRTGDRAPNHVELGNFGKSIWQTKSNGQVKSYSQSHLVQVLQPMGLADGILF